jgi:hypothetical protein
MSDLIGKTIVLNGKNVKVVGKLPDAWLLHYADGPWEGWPLTWDLSAPLPVVLAGETNTDAANAEIGQA